MSNLKMMVCPHDTASNPDRWFMVVQYLAQHLGEHLELEISLDFADFHTSLNQADIVYANPTDSLMLIEQKNFVALARPSNVYDEVVFVANTDVASPSLESLTGVQLASVESLQPTRLALHILREKGIQPAGIENHESWTGVISALWRGEAQYGLVYKDTYDELSEQGKGMVQAFEVSNERVAFHNVLVGNRGLEKQDTIQTMLLTMHTDEKGKEVLQELHMEQWLPTTQDELATMKRIMES